MDRAGEADGKSVSLLRRALAALAVTQVVGWGTTYYLPSVLAADMAAGTGLTVAAVFGGVSIMLAVAALIAPWAGRWLALDGARTPMMTGSLVLAAGLILLAAARGSVLFCLAWAVIGLGMPATLGQAASTAMVQIAPRDARRSITLVLLFSALSSTVFWPVLIVLEARLGWRGTLLVFAALHAGLCLPLHAFGLPRGYSSPRSLVRPDAEPPPEELGPPPVPGAFPLAALCFSLAGFVSWGVPLLLIDVMERLGHARGPAVAIAALIGPSQIAARIVDLAGGHRLDILTVGTGALVLMPTALALLLLGGASAPVAAVAVFAYGVSAGLMSVVRAVSPLPLFGRANYAVALGRLALPQNAVFASSPLLLASVRDGFGASGVLVLALAAALVALAAMVVLARRAARARADVRRPSR